MPRPHPQSVCDRARRLSAVHDDVTVGRIVGISRNTVAKMRRRGWLAPDTTAPRRPMPSDFAIQVRHMGYEELSRHYHASSVAIARWKRELGLPMIVRQLSPCIGRKG